MVVSRWTRRDKWITAGSKLQTLARTADPLDILRHSTGRHP